MSNSSLVNYTKISPNKTTDRIYNGKKQKIDTITVHCAVGQMSVETLGNIFAPRSRQASSNYGIGFDGKIGLYVDEKDRSWCSSSAENDSRAVTIECACDPKAPYAINSKVEAALITLMADICKRNNIKKLIWSTDKKTRVQHLNGANMTVHRDYANKACPGDYIYNRLGTYADKVNEQLGNKVTPSKLYKVQVGAFKKPANANNLVAQLKYQGFPGAIVVLQGAYYKVQVGAFSKKENAEKLVTQLKAKKFDAIIKEV